jgi:hypothetical protein
MKLHWNPHCGCHKAGAHANSPKSHGWSSISSNGPSTGARLLWASPRTTMLSTLPRSSAHPYWRLIQQPVVDSDTMFMIFFQFWPFNKSYYRNDLTKTLFPVLALLVMPNIVVWFWTESRQTPQRDSWPRRHWLSRQFGQV